MDDFEDLPVETMGGERPAGAIGDRLLIGLAAVALLGGLLIAAANLLSGFLPESAAEPSAPAAASEAAVSTATPRPSPTEPALRELSVIPGPPPDADGPGLGAFPTTYWIEALEPLTIHASPDSLAVIGRIGAGGITLGEQQPGEGDATAGWLYAYASEPPGWIRTKDAAGRPRAKLYATERGTFPSAVQAVAAGPTGFVVHGTPPFTGWQPEETLTVVSSDGGTWARAEVESHPWGGWAAAWGPSGWLAVTTITAADGTTATWLWESASGSNWSPVGEIELPGHQFLSQLVGSDRGYLLAVESGDGTGASLWFSRDGLTWQESAEALDDSPAPTSGFDPRALRIAASQAGFLAWRTTEHLDSGTVAAFSLDGRTWTPILLAADQGVAWLSLGMTGDWLLGLGRDAGGRMRAYGGSLQVQPEPIALERTTHLEIAFEGAVVRHVVSDGTTAFAFGSERQGGRDLVWAGDRRGWRRVDAPEGGFGQPVNVAAAGAAGVLAVGAEPNGVVADPVLWHLRTDGTWVREASEIFPRAPRPTPEECGEAPDSAVAFVTLHATVAVPCFGNRPMEFVAWSVDCDGCFGGGSVPPSGPAGWLLNPGRWLLLKPIEDSQGETGFWKEAVPAPGLRWRKEYVGTWLRVRGHYDDPASSDCRTLPSGMDEMYSPGALALINDCRQRFVVTGVTIVEGPSS